MAVPIEIRGSERGAEGDKGKNPNSGVKECVVIGGL